MLSHFSIKDPRLRWIIVAYLCGCHKICETRLEICSDENVCVTKLRCRVMIPMTFSKIDPFVAVKKTTFASSSDAKNHASFFSLETVVQYILYTPGFTYIERHAKVGNTRNQANTSSAN